MSIWWIGQMGEIKIARLADATACRLCYTEGADRELARTQRLRSEGTMQSVHPDIDAAAAKARHADIRHEAERWRQTRTTHLGWLNRQGCWMLCQLGHLLIKLGQRLESYGTGSSGTSVEPAR